MYEVLSKLKCPLFLDDSLFSFEVLFVISSRTDCKFICPPPRLGLLPVFEVDEITLDLA
jgi:hypothetical protein